MDTGVWSLLQSDNAAIARKRAHHRSGGAWLPSAMDMALLSRHGRRPRRCLAQPRKNMDRPDFAICVLLYDFRQRQDLL